MQMFGLKPLSRSIKSKIIAFAIGLIALMVVTTAVSMWMSFTVERSISMLTERFIPVYGELARANIRSLERALTLRRMAIARMQSPPDLAAYQSLARDFAERGEDVERETQLARETLTSIIEEIGPDVIRVALIRLESRLDAAQSDTRRLLNQEIADFRQMLEAGDTAGALRLLPRVDSLRDEMNRKLDVIRADMLKEVREEADGVLRAQRRALILSAVVTALAAALGLIAAVLIGGGITRPVHELLAGTRAIEEGRLDSAIKVDTEDEIGELSSAFNRMVDRLRHNEKVREVFGRYIDPKVAEGLIDQPKVTAGEKRVMTVLFCDLKGFTAMSEGVTPQGLVKLMNHYFTVMSEPIRSHRGVIDKYIGDAIMAYWGPPFVDADEQGALACAAVAEMIARVQLLRRDLPEILGVRSMPFESDIRIGLATGEVLVGSIGSELMMSYTVMGDAVNLASRIESANKLYGSRCLATEASVRFAGNTVELREIDRIVVVGQSQPQVVFEIMAAAGALAPAQDELRRHYGDGLAAYRGRRWDEAQAAFEAGLAAVPDDGPSRAMIDRIAVLRDDPPAADWDGTWRLDSK